MAVNTPTHTGSLPDVEFESPKQKSFELRVGPGPYIGKLSRLEKAPEGNFGPGMFWYWELWNTTEENGKQKMVAAQFNEDGSVYEWRERTSLKFGKNPKNGQIAGARLRAEALLKRDIEDDEDVRAIMNEMLGKPAMLYLVTKQTEQGLFLNAGTVEPYRKGMVAPIQRYEEAAADDELPFDGAEAASDDDDEAPF
jgi:hypothetical protein